MRTPTRAGNTATGIPLPPAAAVAGTDAAAAIPSEPTSATITAPALARLHIFTARNQRQCVKSLGRPLFLASSTGLWMS